MNIRWVKIRTGFAVAYIFGVSCFAGVIGGKALAEHNQPPIRSFVEHCKSGGGALGLEASAAGRTLVVPSPATTTAPTPPPTDQAAATLKV